MSCLWVFTRTRWDRKWNTAALSGLELPSDHFPVHDSGPNPLNRLVDDGLFSTLYPFFFYSRSNASLSLVYSLYPCKISEHATFLPAKTNHDAYMEANHSHYICMTLVMCKFHSDNFLTITLPLWNGIPRGGSPEHYKLNFFKLGLTVIFHRYAINYARYS